MARFQGSGIALRGGRYRRLLQGEHPVRGAVSWSMGIVHFVSFGSPKVGLADPNIECHFYLMALPMASLAI